MKGKLLSLLEWALSLQPVKPLGLTKQLKLTWVASRNPYLEAEEFRAGRVASVYDLVAWDVDFIQELLAHLPVQFSHVNHPSELTNSHIVVYSRNHFSRADVRRGLKQAKPRLVFHLSDEWGRDAPWHQFLRKYPLVLRHHHFNFYPKHKNIVTMPLGYMEGMFRGSTTDQSRIEQLMDRHRALAWSFIGGVKGRRGAALQMFSDIGPHFLGSAHPNDMADIYADSKFVVCPEGNVNILCFRNFEASICGAIPVIAGCSRAAYLEATAPLSNPPWVFHERWEDAIAEVRALLADESALKCRRTQVLLWWRAEFERMRGAIDAVLT